MGSARFVSTDPVAVFGSELVDKGDVQAGWHSGKRQVFFETGLAAWGGLHVHFNDIGPSYGFDIRPYCFQPVGKVS